VNVLVRIEPKSTLQINTSAGQTFLVQDSTHFKLLKSETIIVKDSNTTSNIISFKDVNKDSVILELKSRKPVLQPRGQNFLRGLFAQQYVEKKQPDENKIEVTKKWTTKN
jgi:hypothetical protein